jgi:phage terminase small subunit
MPVLVNAKHELFAQEVAKGATADAAYQAAGYRPSRAHASRLATNGSVVARIAELQAEGADKAGVTVERLARELLKIGFADIGDAVEWGPGLGKVDIGDGVMAVTNGVLLKPSRDLAPDVRAAVSEVRQTREGVAIKFHDKLRAIEMLGRMKGAFSDKVALTGPDGGPIETKELSPIEYARRIAFILDRADRELQARLFVVRE